MKRKLLLVTVLIMGAFVVSCKSVTSQAKEEYKGAELDPQPIYDYLIGVPYRDENLVTYMFNNFPVDLDENQRLLPQDGSVVAVVDDYVDLVFDATAGIFVMDPDSPLAGAARYEYALYVTETETNQLLNITMILYGGLYRDPDTLYEQSYTVTLSVEYEPDENGNPSGEVVEELYTDAIYEVSAIMEEDYQWRIPRF